MSRQSVRLNGRIIPAYAGSTTRRNGRAPSGTDHPRVCGEHLSRFRLGGLQLGSSPRMRGAQLPESRSRQRQGIIPAYAGSTTIHHACIRDIGDHPRVCGEHDCTESGMGTRPGSSPRMRGAHPLGAHPLGEDGIIPAYAGSTFDVADHSLVCGDHPRVCGEHPRRSM